MLKKVEISTFIVLVSFLLFIVTINIFLREDIKMGGKNEKKST